MVLKDEERIEMEWLAVIHTLNFFETHSGSDSVHEDERLASYDIHQCDKN